MENIIDSIQNHVMLLKTAYRRDGFWYVFQAGIKYLLLWPWNLIQAKYHVIRNRNLKTFVYNGKIYKYYYNAYNTTWENERTVEIPIIWDLIHANRGRRVLEIGNVLLHYFPYTHDIVDLYERYLGVINEDIVCFRPQIKYDLIVSISTFEHIGCNDNELVEPGKFIKAIDNVLTNVLAPGGVFILTLPLGQNREMERIIASGIVKFSYISCMQKTDPSHNNWQEVTWEYIKANEINQSGYWTGKRRTAVIAVCRGND